MADLKNIKIGNDTYKGVKKISVQDADVSEMRDSFLSEGFIEDSTQAQDITANGQQTLVPSTGFDATKQIVVNVNVPSSVGGDATAGDIRKDKTAWVNGVKVTGAIETYDGTVEDVVVYTDCLTFTGETSEFTLAVGGKGAKEWDGTLYYSTDHNTWNVWDGTAISSANKKLYLRGKGNTTFYDLHGARLSLSAKASCSGNIQTLLDWESPPTSISTGSCYSFMFDGCTNLTTAPVLPATTLAGYCYNNMFYGCTNLTTAPVLPATTLANYCYQHMFAGCTNLTTAPSLPATTLANSCYSGMFYGCTNLTTAPVLPATKLVYSCYSYMFDGCTNLTTAPVLPATTLAESCYSYMFDGCTSLTSAPALPATTLANDCYSGMFKGCTSLTTAPALPATTLAYSCYSYMFMGCTNLTTAPALPATTLASSCYYYMFRGCTKLKLSTTQTTEYKTPWRIPSSGTISSEANDWNTDMLANTGGTFTGNPSINTTYYGAW